MRLGCALAGLTGGTALGHGIALARSHVDAIPITLDQGLWITLAAALTLWIAADL